MNILEYLSQMMHSGDMVDVLIVSAIIAYMVLLSISVISWVNKIVNCKVSSVNNDITKINIGTTIDYEIGTKLDDFIKQCWDNYIVLHPEISSTIYIDAETEKKLRDELSTMVTSRMSTFFYNKLTLYYNARSIGSVVGEKVMITIIDYVAGNNAKKADVSELTPGA